MIFFLKVSYLIRQSCGTIARGKMWHISTLIHVQYLIGLQCGPVCICVQIRACLRFLHKHELTKRTCSRFSLQDFNGFATQILRLSSKNLKWSLVLLVSIVSSTSFCIKKLNLSNFPSNTCPFLSIIHS